MSIHSRPIHLLNEKTINQIAAGEVIENASSVVKELVENAIDAGASSISVETQAGGQALIRVSDNGCGMERDDLMLCLERHATSKISELNDLDKITSLGFRGEALPSIASISKMKLHSASLNHSGSFLLVEGGKILGSKPEPRNRGTTIEVKSLFFNVPVRKKFQKSVTADNAEIHKTLIRTALCYPSIGLSWVQDGKTQFSFSDQDDLKQRIETLLGEEFGKNILPINHREGAVQISGFIARPSFHRPNRTGQYLFLNHRSVSSSFISARVLEGYATRLPSSRFPLFILHIQLPSDWIDVNVHPQKKEIRLRNESQIADFLIRNVEQALQKSYAPKPADNSILIDWSEDNHEESFFFFDELEEPALPKPEFWAEKKQTMQEQKEVYQTFQEELPLKIMYRVIKVFGNYLLAEDQHGVFIIHVQAAYSRIVFEEKKNNRPTAIQQLLIPLNLEFNPSEQGKLIEKMDEINHLGISIRYFGGNTFIVDAIPQFFDMEEIKNLLHKLLEGDPILTMSLAAKKRVQSVDEGDRLLEQLFKCQVPHETPDGRPTYFYLTEDFLSQRFKR